MYKNMLSEGVYVKSSGTTGPQKHIFRTPENLKECNISRWLEIQTFLLNDLLDVISVQFLIFDEIKFEIINKFNQKVLVIRAGGKNSNDTKDLFSTSVTDPKLSEMFLNGKDLLINDVTHFIPQEKPGECAKIIYDFIR